MGDLRMCFDASAYNRALADVENLGFDVKDQQTWLEGKYYCSNGDSEEDIVLIDKRQPVTGHVNGQPVWVDGSGRMFKVIEYNDLPDGVTTVVWDIHIDDDLMFRSLRDFYQCEVKNNKKCVDQVTAEYSSKKIEKGRAQVEHSEEAVAESAEDRWVHKKMKEEAEEKKVRNENAIRRCNNNHGRWNEDHCEDEIIFPGYLK